MTQPHETLLKLGYPGSLIAEYANWAVMLRNEQPTLGCLVLSVRGDYRRMPEVPAEAFAELPRVTGDIEAALKGAFAFDKINWLVLMMRDPQVHFHVIPRYAAPRDFLGRRFADPGWPKAPSLFTLLDLSADELAALKAHILGYWPKG